MRSSWKTKAYLVPWILAGSLGVLLGTAAAFWMAARTMQFQMLAWIATFWAVGGMASMLAFLGVAPWWHRKSTADEGLRLISLEKPERAVPSSPSRAA